MLLRIGRFELDTTCGLYLRIPHVGAMYWGGYPEREFVWDSWKAVRSVFERWATVRNEWEDSMRAALSEQAAGTSAGDMV